MHACMRGHRLTPVQRLECARLLMGLAAGSAVVREQLAEDDAARKHLRRELHELRVKMKRCGRGAWPVLLLGGASGPGQHAAALVPHPACLHGRPRQKQCLCVWMEDALLRKPTLQHRAPGG